uniref:Secreted peptide n=1 Tax=Anopheles braziliensis TaxID=58242 RepID=A0A2M3ZLR9_9DIPT
MRCDLPRGATVLAVAMLTGAGVEGISLAGDACGGALSPVSVSPLICNASAVLMNPGKASCFTFTSPQYINCMRSFRTEWLTSFRKMNACWLTGICINIFRK